MTTQERVFLNGAPAVGFGESAPLGVKHPAIWTPFAGYFVGSIGGAILGTLVKKGVGTAIGAIAGGFGGAIAGGAIGHTALRSMDDELARLRAENAK